jgi:hypothetical protein
MPCVLDVSKEVSLGDKLMQQDGNMAVQKHQGRKISEASERKALCRLAELHKPIVLEY